MTDHIKPSTLKGIKRLAKQIGRDQGIRHTAALEVAARQAGFTNYADALRSLPPETNR